MTILHYGKPLSLPDLVPMRHLLSEYDPSGWNRLDLGIDASGGRQGIHNRYRAPHTLVAGSTGSGKTITLQMLAAQALTRGHDVVYANLMSFPDFNRLEPWLKHTAATVHEAAEMIERIRTEQLRRFRVLTKNCCGFWMELPESEQIRPLTVIIDEFDHLASADPVSEAWPLTEIERVKSLNDAKAKLIGTIRQIAASGRAAGVHLVIGTQKVDTDYLGAELEANLTARILSVSPSTPPTGTAQRLMFGASAGDAEALIDNLRSEHRGLAIVQPEIGSGLHGVRIGYAHWDDIPAILEELSVPRATPGFPDYTPLQDDDDM